MKQKAILITLVILALLAADFWFVRTGLLTGDRSVSDENGPMENVQAIACGLAALVFLRTALRATRGRELAGFFALLLTNFFFREVDVDDPKLGVHWLIIFFTQGIGRTVLLAPLWVWLAWKIFRRARNVLRDLVDFSATYSAVIFAVGMAFGFAGQIFDGMHGHKTATIFFFEEFTEVNGYTCLLIAALLYDPAAPSSIPLLKKILARILPRSLRPDTDTSLP